MMEYITHLFMIVFLLVENAKTNFELPYTAVTSLNEEYILDIFEAVVPALPDERYFINAPSDELRELISIGKFEKISSPFIDSLCVIKEFNLNKNLSPKYNAILDKETPYDILHERGQIDIVYWIEGSMRLLVYRMSMPTKRFSDSLSLRMDQNLGESFVSCSRLVYFVEIDSFYNVCSKGMEGKMNLFLIRLSVNGIGYYESFIGTLVGDEIMKDVKIIKLTTSSPDTIRILFYKVGSPLFKIIELEINSRPISEQEYNFGKNITRINYYSNSILVFYSKTIDKSIGTNYYIKLLPGDRIKMLEPRVLGVGMISYVDVETDSNQIKFYSMIIPIFNISKPESVKTDRIIMTIYSYDESNDLVEVQFSHTFDTFGNLARLNSSSIKLLQSYNVLENSIKIIRLYKSLRLIRFDFTIQSQNNEITKHTFTQSLNPNSKVLYNFHLRMEVAWDKIFDDFTGRGLWAYSKAVRLLPSSTQSKVKCRLFWLETENPIIKKKVGAHGFLSRFGDEIDIKLSIQKANTKEITDSFMLKVLDGNKLLEKINWLYWRYNGKLNHIIRNMKNNYKLSIRELVGGGFVKEIPLPKSLGEITIGYSADLLYTKFIADISQRLYNICVSEMTSAIKLFNSEPKVYHAIKLFSLVEYNSYPSNIQKDYAKSIPYKGFCIRNKDNERINSHCIIQVKGSEDHFIIAKNNRTTSFRQLLSIKLGNIVQRLSFSINKVLTLSDKGDINLLEGYEDLRVTSISYPGTACMNMEIAFTSNSKALLLCLSQDLLFTVFHLNELVNGLNTESIMYRDRDSFFDMNYDPSEMVVLNPKVGGFKDLIFVFVKNSPIDKINTFIFKLEVNSFLTLKLVMKMNIRPRPEESVAAYGKISDFRFFNEYLVCTVKGINHEDYICVYNIGIGSYFGLGIILSSCYNIPRSYNIIDNSRIGMYCDSGAIDDTYPGYVTVQLEKSGGKAKNIYLIDPSGSNINRIKTALLPFSLSDRMIVLDVYGENRKTVSESVGLIAYREDNLHESMIIIADFNTVGINLAKFKSQIPNHAMIQSSSFKGPDNLNLEVEIKIKTIFVNEIELVLNGSPLEKIFLPISYSLIIKTQETLESSNNSNNELLIEPDEEALDWFNKESTPIAKIPIDRSIRGNVFKTILQESTEQLDQYMIRDYWRRERFLTNLTSRSNIRVIQLCKHIIYRYYSMFCETPVTWIEDNNQMKELEGMRANSSLGQIFNLTDDCSRRTAFNNYFMAVCKFEGDNYLEIIEIDTIQSTLTILSNLQEGEPSNFEIEIIGTEFVNILVIKNVVKGSISATSYYLMENADKKNALDIYLTFLKKDSFGGNSLFWRVSDQKTISVKSINFYLTHHGQSSTVIKLAFSFKIYTTKKYGKKISIVLTSNLNYKFSYNKEITERFFYNDRAMVIDFDNKFIYNESTNTFPLLFYFPKGHSFLVFCSNDEFTNMRKIRLQNPFAELDQKKVIEPICKDWLCVFPSVFVDYSYLSMYYIDRDWVEGLDKDFPYVGMLNEKMDSRHFIKETIYGDSEIMENLLQNYTIYTFSVAHLPMIEISKIFWDPIQNMTNELSFLVVTYDGEVYRYTVVNTLNVYTKNGKVDDDRLLNLIYYGMANSTLSKKVRLRGFKSKNMLTNLFWLGFIILISATTVWMISCMIRASQYSDSVNGD